MADSAHTPALGPLEPVLLAGSVNLLAGTSGVGKTAFLALLAKLLSHQAPVFGVAPTLPSPPYQAYIGTNRSWVHSSAKWFALEGLQGLKHYSLVDDKVFKKRRMRTKADRLAILEECLAKVSPKGGFPTGSLVYVDSLSLFLGGNLLDADSTAVALLEVRELCQQHNEVAVRATARPHFGIDLPLHVFGYTDVPRGPRGTEDQNLHVPLGPPPQQGQDVQRVPR